MWFNACQIALLLMTIARINCSPCKFNSGCDCQTVFKSRTTIVRCYNFTTFPTFHKYMETFIESIAVSGNFTYVPAKAFNSLKFLPGVTFAIGRENHSHLPLFIDQNAFSSVPIASLHFYHVTFPTLPTLALMNKTMKNLHFTFGNLENIQDYAFYGLTITESLSFVYTGMRTISPNAFSGMNSDNTTLKIFHLEGSELTEISPAFKSLKVEKLSILRGNITEINDNAFCGDTTCVIEKLDLTGNPINYISPSAFSGMPLKHLSLFSLNLTEIPLGIKIASLESLDLRSNRIENVTNGAFSYMRSLISLKLDYNPISEIRGQMFDQTSNMTKWLVSNLNKLDFFDICAITNLFSLLEFKISTCPSLSTLYFNSQCVYSLSQNFTLLDVSGNDIKLLDDYVEMFLQQRNITIDISFNYNFICNSNIAWMAQYVLCRPVRIITTGTTCAGTKLSLSSYLSMSFETICP